MQIPVVSVIVPTYNHEKYISECIKGILNQKVNFLTEIIIGDDCSTDKTQEIIGKEIASNNDKLKSFNLIFHKTNLLKPNILPGIANFLKCYDAAKGKYIALCEGDDYWTDPLKLQKQVDFLEGNKNYKGVCHNTKYSFENLNKSFKKKSLNNNRKKGVLTAIDVLTENPVHFNSLLFRNSNVSLPDFYIKIPHPDELLFLIIYKNGGLYYLPETMSTYRIHEGGITNTFNGIKYHKSRIENLDLLDSYLEKRHSKLIAQIKSHQYLAIAMKSSDMKIRFINLKDALKHNPTFLFTHLKSILSIIYRTFKPKK